MATIVKIDDTKFDPFFEDVVKPKAEKSPVVNINLTGVTPFLSEQDNIDKVVIATKSNAAQLQATEAAHLNEAAEAALKVTINAPPVIKEPVTGFARSMHILFANKSQEKSVAAPKEEKKVDQNKKPDNDNKFRR